MTAHPTGPDESWPMVQEAVRRVFADAVASNPNSHSDVSAALADLGFGDIEADYPIESARLLFAAEACSLAQSDSLSRIMLAELIPAADPAKMGVVFPAIDDGAVPAVSNGKVDGIALGGLDSRDRWVVTTSRADGEIEVAVVDAATLSGTRMDTFDPSVQWTAVAGELAQSDLRSASAHWRQALAAGHRGLATELIELAAGALTIACELVSVRKQFGAEIGSFQSPRHGLAQAHAQIEGARALLDQSWRYGGYLSATAAKAAAGRAHRAVSDATIQVCGAIGLTAEHELNRYVMRGIQLDALLGGYRHLDELMATRLFNELYTPYAALPSIVTW